MARRRTVLTLWLAAIAALALWAWASVHVTSDLSGFLPDAVSLNERVLLAQVREGVAARTLLVAIAADRPGGDRSEVLAAASRALARSLKSSQRFVWIANGEPPPLDDSALGRLFAYRYLVGPAEGCVSALSADGLRAALGARLRELTSAVPALDKARMAADPTACFRALLRSLVPRQGPARRQGVWMARDGTRALLVLQTAGDATDIQAQAAAIAEVRHAFDALPETPRRLRLELAGPGYFAAASAESIRGETVLLGSAATVLVSLVLLIAFRSPTLVALGALPGIAGLLVGLVLVQQGFGFVHGIALALGTTLFGVALDYPAHVFSHVAPDAAPGSPDQGIWPTLLLAAAATVMGYGALALTPFQGLAQLGILSAAGLATAALCARFLLPALIPANYRLPEHPWLDWAWLDRWRSSGARGARWAPWIGVSVAAGLLAATLIAHPHPWESDLGRLSTVPAADIARDRQLRAELGAPDVARFLFATAGDPQSLLATLEGALPALRDLERDRVIAGFDAAPLWVPSAGAQQARVQALPEPAELARRVERASQGLPFRPGAFAPFLDSVEGSRDLPPLLPADLAGTPLGVRLGLLLQPMGERWLGLVPLTGVADGATAEARLRSLARSHGMYYLDLRAATAGLLGRFLHETLGRALLLGLAICLVLAVGLRDGRLLLRVLTPMAIALTLDFSLILWLEGSANLFHLVSLLLVLGLAIDYSLFFNRPMAGGEARRRTRLSLTVCAASTFATFGLLALSGIPVLHAIGTTVAVGNLLAFALAALLARPAAPAAGVRASRGSLDRIDTIAQD